MKTLLLMRHAKSSWKEAGIADHDRKLNKRGKRDAPRIASLLEKHQLVPNVILSSSAVRACKTATLVAESSPFSGDILTTSQLYMASPYDIMSAIDALDDSYTRALVIGHNPGMQQLVCHLTARDESFPTAAVAAFEIPVASWSFIDMDQTAKLIGLWRPRELE